MRPSDSTTISTTKRNRVIIQALLARIVKRKINLHDIRCTHRFGYLKDDYVEAIRRGYFGKKVVCFFHRNEYSGGKLIKEFGIEISYIMLYILSIIMLNYHLLDER